MPDLTWAQDELGPFQAQGGLGRTPIGVHPSPLLTCRDSEFRILSYHPAHDLGACVEVYGVKLRGSDGMMILNLTRKLRRKSRRDGRDDKYSLPTWEDTALDDYHPIDTQEQEAFVTSLERSHAKQSFLWRCVFAAFLFCFVAFLISSIFQQASSPWELRFHAYFMDEVQSWIVISADCVAVFACMMAITGLLNDSKSHRKWIWYSCYTGVLLAIFWLHYMLRMPKFRWDILWLPFGPLSGAVICLYVDTLFAESLEDVGKLRRSMYAYKAS